MGCNNGDTVHANSVGLFISELAHVSYLTYWHTIQGGMCTFSTCLASQGQMYYLAIEHLRNAILWLGKCPYLILCMYMYMYLRNSYYTGILCNCTEL